MAGLGSTPADLAQLRRTMSDVMEQVRSHLPGGGGGGDGRLVKVAGFGANPGGLEMLLHVPERLAPEPALVVALHGCGQTAASYDLGAGWSTLADRYGFVLLLPQQPHGNNPQGCFNWFKPGDTTRGSGEAASIRAMIAHAAAEHGIARERVFVAGLSAGAAMAAAMLATYPEVFAGGAIVAGLPYGAAGSVQEAMECMVSGRPRPARAWGDLVRAASPHRGPWPTISVWHGDADAVVRSGNAAETLKQWTDVHGVGATPALFDVVDGFSREVWRDASGREVIESYTIPGMGHGVPLAVGGGADACGAAGAFMLDVGISSSYHIAKFWGLTGERVEQPRPAASAGAHASAAREEIIPPGQPGPSPRPVGPDASGGSSEWWHPGKFKPETLAGDVMDVIDKALKTAGLSR